MKPQIKDSTSSLSQGLLRVTIVEATNLPKMDLLRASDPYCLVFLTDDSGEPGEIVYRTEVILHNRWGGSCVYVRHAWMREP